MRLKIFLPVEIFMDGEVDKITANAENGSFTILPRHIDFLTSLKPGILIYESEGQESFIALDGGILIKKGHQAFISTRRAIRGKRLGELRQAVEDEFLVLDEKERKTRSVIARLESDFIHRFLQMK